MVNVKSTNIKNYGCSWNKLFEYMASGKPVLSNVYMQYDLISRFNIGIAKEFQSAEDYAKVMIEFSNLDTNIYTEMCNNAKAVAQKFDYKYLTEKIEYVLYSAVSN